MAKRVRKKEDHKDRYNLRLQGGKGGLVEATSKMDISEFRVFATALTMILPDDEEFTEYEIRIPDIIKLFDLNRNGNYYESFKDAALNLMDRKFVIFETQEDGKEYKNTIPLSIKTREAVDPADRTQIRLQFHPMLKPYLLDLKREYLTVDVRNLTNIQSHYTVKLYFILKHQQRLGNSKRTYLVSELRRILAIEEGEYSLYGNFKQQIIKKGIKDINKYTDLHITKIEEHKKVRAIESITFFMEAKTAKRELELDNNPKNKKQVVKLSNAEIAISNPVAQSSTELDEYELLENTEQSETVKITQIFSKVKKYKIAKSTVTKWVSELPYKQVEIGVEYVLNKIASGESIKNVGGYLHNMVNSPTLFEVQKQELDDKKQKQSERQQINHSKREEQEEQKKKDNLLNSYTRAKNEVIKSIITSKQLTDTIIQSLQQQAQGEKPVMLVQLAFEKYQAFQESYQGDNPLVEALDKAGFSLTTYVSDWITKEYPDSLQEIKAEYQKQADLIGINLE
jgi:plasmid replication initiation protein